MAQAVKSPPAMQETVVQSLGREDPLGKGMATHSSVLAWRIPWTEEPGWLQSTGLRRVGHEWLSSTFTSWVPIQVPIQVQWERFVWHLGESHSPSWIFGLWGSDVPSELPLRFLDKLSGTYFLFFRSGQFKVFSFPGVLCSFCWRPAVWRASDHISLRSTENPPLFSDPWGPAACEGFTVFVRFRLSEGPVTGSNAVLRGARLPEAP